MSKIVLTGKATDLSVLEVLNPHELFAPKGTDHIYDAISQEVAAFIPDMTSEEGRKEIASMAYKIAQSKNFLDKVGKTFNSLMKEKTKAVDTERGAIWDKLEALQKKVRAPLDAYEAAEEARVQAHKDAMAHLENITVFDHPPTYEEIKQRQSMFGELHTRKWDEFNDMAMDLFTQQHSKLHHMGVTAAQAERDRAELEALRAAKAEQDAKDAEAARQKAADEQRTQIEREATEKAQAAAAAMIKALEIKEAQAAEKAKADAAESERRIKEADEARIAAEARAKLEADRAVQDEKDRAAAEQKRLADEATARENDRAHHAKINNEAANAIMDIKGVDLAMAKEIVKAIAFGQITHIKITY